MRRQKKTTEIIEKDKLKAIQKRYSAGMYLLAFASLFYPWMVIGKKRYSLASFGTAWLKDGTARMLERAGAQEDLSYGGGFCVFFGVLLLYLILSAVYLGTVLADKNWNINYGAVLLSVAVAVASTEEYMPGRLCGGNIIVSTMFPFIFLFFSGFECVGRKIIESWDETLRATLAYREKEKREKEERKRRLAFPGKYSRLFYEAIWKNFKKSLRDYAMLFFCNALVFMVVFSGFGLWQVIKEGDVSLKVGYPVGAGKILLSSLMELGAVGLFMLVLLLLYYLKRRIPEYGMFSTLGIRRQTMYLCMGAELLLGGGLSLLLGGIFGGALVGLLRKRLGGGEGWLSPLLILASAGVIVIFYLVTFCVTHDIFVGLRMGSSVDLSALGEKLPGKRFRVFTVAGLVICVCRLTDYAKNINYENIDQLIVCFFGIYLVLRYGMAWYLARQKRKGRYLDNLFGLHAFYHRSRSAVWYLFGLCVIQCCILGLFGVQVFSAGLIPDADALSPYDLVCLAGEGQEDEAFIQSLNGREGIQATDCPMVRVIGEKGEQPGRLVTARVNSQNIGISESSYHALKKARDPRYKKKALGFGKGGAGIYIVHQQDKGTKARPADYSRDGYYVGTVYEYAKGVDEWGDNELAEPYRVIGEETAALMGIMCQGERENLIVFSDTYFAKARESLEELEYPGPTRLVLVNADAAALKRLEPDLAAFKERHAIDEKYDAKVKSYYLKADAQKRFLAELNMRTVMGELLIPLFFLAGILLWKIRLMTEHGPNKRRTEFLACMGMRKRQRMALLRREMWVYMGILLLISVPVSACIVSGTFKARFYEAADILYMLKRVIPFAVCELAEFCFVLAFMTEREIRLLERKVQ